MVAYAAADVVHLPALVASLRADLEATGRLEWHGEECERLAAAPFPEERETRPGERLADQGDERALGDRERAFVRALWEVREARARALDLPPFRVLTNERLLHAARLAAAGEGDLLRLFPGPRPLPGALAAEIRRALDAARALPPAAWPKPRRGAAAEADPALEREVERLKKERDRKAAALALDPGVLASRAVLTAAARALLDERSRSIARAPRRRRRHLALAGRAPRRLSRRDVRTAQNGDHAGVRVALGEVVRAVVGVAAVSTGCRSRSPAALRVDVDGHPADPETGAEVVREVVLDPAADARREPEQRLSTGATA